MSKFRRIETVAKLWNGDSDTGEAVVNVDHIVSARRNQETPSWSIIETTDGTHYHVPWDLEVVEAYLNEPRYETMPDKDLEQVALEATAELLERRYVPTEKGLAAAGRAS